MGTGIQQQIDEIHQKVREFVEDKYQGYRVYSIRNCSCTFYAEYNQSVISMAVEAIKGDYDLDCLVSVQDDTMMISNEVESPSGNTSS